MKNKNSIRQWRDSFNPNSKWIKVYVMEKIQSFPFRQLKFGDKIQKEIEVENWVTAKFTGLIH